MAVSTAPIGVVLCACQRWQERRPNNGRAGFGKLVNRDATQAFRGVLRDLILEA